MPAGSRSQPRPSLIASTIASPRWFSSYSPALGATSGGVSLPLSNVEYRLLVAFADHPGEVLSRAQLVELTRSATSETENNERSIDLAVSRLRAKLREAPEDPRFIRTVRGRGYQFTGDLVT